MSINLGNKQSVMFVGDKFVKNVYLGNKILQPWATIKSFAKVSEYADTYSWSYQSSSSSFMNKDGYIKFPQPVLTGTIRIDSAGYPGISSPSGTLKVLVKNQKRETIMSSELRFAYVSSSSMGTTYNVTNVVSVNNSMYSGEFSVTFGDGLINWQPFTFTLGSSTVNVKMWNLNGGQINFDVSLDEAYSGYTYEILNTSSQNFDINFMYMSFTGNFPEPGQYRITYQKGIADSSTGLPSNVTLNRNEEYTFPTNVMTRAPHNENTYTVTYNYNYTGAPSNDTDTAYKVLTFTANGWTTNSALLIPIYHNGQVVTNVIENIYGDDSQLQLYPCFNRTYSTTKVTLPTPTRSGYRFLNWNSRQDGTGTRMPGGFEYTPVANVVLYAQWEAE